MAEVRPKMRWGVEEDEIMGLLFGEEIKCLGSDGFEGSSEERRICMTVLYEVNISNFGNALSKMGNSESKECSLNKQTGYANTENLVHVNPHSLNDTLMNVEVKNNNVNGVLGLKRHHLQSMTTSNNTNAKRLKISSFDPLQIKELATTITKNDTPCSSMNPANQKDKSGSFNVFGDGIWRALPLQESDTDTCCNTHGRNEELGVVRQQSRNNSGNIFMVDPAHEHPAVGPINRKQVNEIEKAKMCESNGGKENQSYVIKKNYTQQNKSFDEGLIPDPGSSQEAGEVKKTGLYKKRGRKKQHSVEINDPGSSQEAGEVGKTIVCKKRRKEQTA